MQMLKILQLCATILEWNRKNLVRRINTDYRVGLFENLKIFHKVIFIYLIQTVLYSF